MRKRCARRFAAVAVVILALSACSSSKSAPPAATKTGPVPIDTVAPSPPTGAAPAASAVTAVSPWPAALHDPRHSSFAAVAGPQSGSTKWTRKLEGPISAGPAVAADGTIYASSNGGVLHALDPATGADKWTFNRGGSADNGQDLSTAAAVLPDGTVLWPAPGGKLVALDGSGKMLWSETLRGTVLSPAVVGEKVFVADTMGDVVALKPAPSGDTKLWTLNIGKASFGSPAVSPDGTIYGTADRDLVAIADGGDHGTVKWRFTAGSDIEVSPSVSASGTVILGTNDQFEYGITPDGHVAWKYPRKVFSYSTPAAAGDLAYFGDNDGYVDVVAAADGKIVGRYDGTAKPISNLGVGVWTAPLVDANHNVYFGTASGHVFGFTYNGHRLFDLDTGATVDSYPALTSDGTLIIGADNATLYAIHG